MRWTLRSTQSKVRKGDEKNSLLTPTKVRDVDELNAAGGIVVTKKHLLMASFHCLTWLTTEKRPQRLHQ